MLGLGLGLELGVGLGLRPPVGMWSGSQWGGCSVPSERGEESTVDRAWEVALALTSAPAPALAWAMAGEVRQVFCRVLAATHFRHGIPNMPLYVCRSIVP